MKRDMVINCASFASSFSICAICLDPNNAKPLLGLGLISLTVISLNQIFKAKHTVLVYIGSIIGISFGLIARMAYDNVNKLYDHNLAGIELFIVVVISSIALAVVFLIDMLMAKVRRG